MCDCAFILSIELLHEEPLEKELLREGLLVEELLDSFIA